MATTNSSAATAGCLDIRTGDVVANDTQLQQFWCNAAYPSEQWLLVPAPAPSGAYKLVTRPGGKCVDLNNGDTSNGARIQMWDCADTTNQYWTFG